MSITTARTAQLPLPTDLEHEPLCAVPYVRHDGKWSGNTDAQHLSLGRAQWNKEDLAVKVFRHTETRWSRQSEELPIHRAVDIVAFAALAIFSESDELPAGTLEHQEHPLKITRVGNVSPATLEADFPADIHAAQERLRKLRKLLNDLHEEGKL